MPPSRQAGYAFAADPAWDHIARNASLALLAKKCQAVCFGSLAQRAPESRRTVREFLENTSAECLRIFDVNLRQNFFSREVIESSLGFANVFKLNNDEVPVVADLLGLPKDEKAFVLAVGLLRGEDLSHVHQRAVDVAAFVCTKPGATPELLPEFRR